MVFECVPFLLAHVIADVTFLTKARAGSEAKRQFEIMVDPKLPRCVMGDSHRLRQILHNILANAWKFTETGTVRLSVTAVGEPSQHDDLEPSCPVIASATPVSSASEQTVAPAAKHEAKQEPKRPVQTILFTVADTGLGMSPEVLSKLFQPFSQADASTTRKFGGTGLGLAISQRLAHEMRSKIETTSTCGVGSTFFFSIDFPICTEQEGQACDNLHSRVPLVSGFC